MREGGGSEVREGGGSGKGSEVREGGWSGSEVRKEGM